MKFSRWPRRSLFIAMSASILSACTSSIRLPTSPTARIPASDLQAPVKLPKVQRLPDGTMDGMLALSSFGEVYDVAGLIRLQLVALQCKVLASQGQPLRADCPRAIPEPIHQSGPDKR
jgi:hypothetical protein